MVRIECFDDARARRSEQSVRQSGAVSAKDDRGIAEQFYFVLERQRIRVDNLKALAVEAMDDFILVQYPAVRRALTTDVHAFPRIRRALAAKLRSQPA